MAHPGLTFALAVGVALGALLYYLFPGNTNAEQPYQYDGVDDNIPVSSSWMPPKSKKRKHKNDSGDDCSICLSIINYSKELTQLKCGHIFHRHCIVQWFREQRVCPNCRSLA